MKFKLLERMQKGFSAITPLFPNLTDNILASLVKLTLLFGMVVFFLVIPNTNNPTIPVEKGGARE